MPEDKIWYTGVVLNDSDINSLKNLCEKIKKEKPELSGFAISNINTTHGNEQCNHHMTVTPGPASDEIKDLCGTPYSLNIDAFGILGDKVAGWRVTNCSFPEVKVPHITAMLGNGKPFEAGKITNWIPLLELGLKP
ncbi:MAG: hypothetical protein NTW30_06205, partial [Candidatus Aenigmarchaeota archaeon]|nr:hypothetical protein [Candidatus Aenigmarchaeota archaeon]